jgi:lactate dehydrogenase-like 2-hydroxyacid dehydrogenase
MFELDGCDGLLSMLTTPVDGEVVAAAHSLRVVSQMASGVDNIDLAACQRHNIRLGHTPDVLTETVADSAFAILGSVVRRLSEGEAMVREGRWGPWDPWEMLGGDLHAMSLGIVGMGRIGRAVARRAVGFDMRVLYASRRSHTIQGCQQVSFEELLAQADAVILTAALTPETEGLIDAEALEMMREGAYLVNVARGRLIDTDALVAALGKGIIGGVGLDVTHPEPLPAGHPLLGFTNCLVVPHIGSASRRARTKMANLAVANLFAGLSGDAMPCEYPLGR